MKRKNCCLNHTVSREVGHKRFVGEFSKIQGLVASSVRAVDTWNPGNTVDHTHHGGVFNFDFSKDGSVLGVACERRSVLLFDPFNRKLIGYRNKAHNDCVNCVRFLDDRLFATCSDDTTVALWDCRYLKKKVRKFLGHSNWVKNIEYASDLGLLVTSGFDGCIYTWDINRYSEEQSSNRVFFTNGLMRSKLSPDNSQLLISTHEGYMIIIRNLNLLTLAEDLKGFKPSMYRLMQRSQTPLRMDLMYNHVFEQKRNRVEFLSDWPTGNDANIISSLQVHPQGWCALSRNTHSDESAEWTCVHDIQDFDHEEDKHQSMSEVIPQTSSSYCGATNTPAFSSMAPSRLYNSVESSSSSSIQEGTGHSQDEDVAGTSPSQRRTDSIIAIRRGARQPQGQFSFTISVHTSSGRTIELNQNDFESDEDSSVDQPVRINIPSDENNQHFSSDSDDSDVDEIIDYRANRVNQQAELDTTVTVRTEPPDTSNIDIVGSNSASSRQRSQDEANTSGSNTVNSSNSEGGASTSVRLNDSAGSNNRPRANSFTFVLQSNSGRRIFNLRYMDSYTDHENSIMRKKIYQNKKRLLCFAEECNVGRGFIKEVGFSSDGRLICSPFGFGLRLFSFNPQCDELCDCVPMTPVKLYEVTCSLAHGNCVVATKFSPKHCLVVSGCLDGRIAFHQPVL
ncbi:hypothetical protein CHS0354_016626 [Potamilus streckersoni]|uniref:Uncharacterized protein n=1 Tax=Potamilus streckersoni TaxID=2493646 RepID=A0AAE0TIW8_9BIVA|nr:hypothetical protein CHS0354_016626 [Potamilus streckersoni]